MQTTPACVVAAAVAVYVSRTSGAAEVEVGLADDAVGPVRVLRVAVLGRMSVRELVAAVALEASDPPACGEQAAQEHDGSPSSCG